MVDNEKCNDLTEWRSIPVAQVSQVTRKTQIVGARLIVRALRGDRTFQFQLLKLPAGFKDKPRDPLKALCTLSRADRLLFSRGHD